MINSKKYGAAIHLLDTRLSALEMTLIEHMTTVPTFKLWMSIVMNKLKSLEKKLEDWDNDKMEELDY